ncbi:MAG: DUF6049 family protein [Actinomycetota bacterium]
MKRIGAVLAIASWLVAVPARAQDAVDVNTTLIVRVASSPLFDPDGTPAEDADAQIGRLATELRALRAVAELPPFALAVSPVLCDEATLLRTEAASRFLRELRTTAARATILVQPYADARLAGLGSRRVVDELSRGRSALESCIERKSADVGYPPDLEIDADVADALAGLRLQRAFTARPAPFTVSDVLFLPTRETSTDVLPTLAVSVDLTEEQVAAIASLVTNDELRFGTIDEFVASAEAPADVLPNAPRPTYLDDVVRAERSLAGFDSFLPDDRSPPRLFAVLRTATARVASSAEWDGRAVVARSRARGLQSVVTRETAHIRIHSAPVTFTARQGALPVTITNDADYPIAVQIHVSSSKLDFRDPDEIVTIDPPGDTVTFDATTRSTGTFPTDVHVTSPGGDIRFDEAELIVRSTAANLSAVLLTAGGAIFLLVWLAGRIRRRAVAQRS